MSYEIERQLIAGRFHTEWNPTPDVPVDYDNIKFTQPPTEWVRLAVIPGESFAVTVGAPDSVLYRHMGILAVQVFVPVDTGTARCFTLAETAGNIYRGQTLIQGAVRIRFRSPTVSAPLLSDGWHQRTVSVAYERDEIY